VRTDKEMERPWSAGLSFKKKSSSESFFIAKNGSYSGWGDTSAPNVGYLGGADLIVVYDHTDHNGNVEFTIESNILEQVKDLVLTVQSDCNGSLFKGSIDLEHHVNDYPRGINVIMSPVDSSNGLTMSSSDLSWIEEKYRPSNADTKNLEKNGYSYKYSFSTDASVHDRINGVNLNLNVEENE
jgi:hypothetical protein